MSDTKQYNVLKAISFRGDRIEAKSTIHATDEEALNIGIGEYLSPVVAAQSAEAEVETPETEAGESTDATPKETSTEATPEVETPEATSEATPETEISEATPIEETRVEDAPTGTEAETPTEDVAA